MGLRDILLTLLPYRLHGYQVWSRKRSVVPSSGKPDGLANLNFNPQSSVGSRT